MKELEIINFYSDSFSERIIPYQKMEDSAGVFWRIHAGFYIDSDLRGQCFSPVSGTSESQYVRTQPQTPHGPASLYPVDVQLAA